MRNGVAVISRETFTAVRDFGEDFCREPVNAAGTWAYIGYGEYQEDVYVAGMQAYVPSL